MLTREDLVKPHTKEVTVEGGTVVIRCLTADEAISMAEMDLKGKEILGLVSISFYDPVMTAEDVGMLPSTMLKKLIEEIFLFNGMTKKAIADAQTELKKTISAEQPTE